MQSRLRCYNQYPGLYENFDSMREDLQRIRHLGFDQVWVNPFYTPCQTNLVPNMGHRIHSPYAMQSEVVYPRYAADEAQVIAYTKAAKSLGLTPMFDLVPRHVAIDHRFVTGDKDLLEKYYVDTTKWFKRHNNGNLQMYFMTENYIPTSDNPWCDVAAFDYDKPDIRAQIIKYFWEPFLKYTIETLGFSGIRVDAPGMIPNDVLREIVDIAKKYHVQTQNDKQVILAETIGGFVEENLGLKGIITHGMNSVYWMPGPEGGFGHDYSVCWQDDDNWFVRIKGTLQSVAPTVGYPGSHDEERYMKLLHDKGVQQQEIIDKRMRERFAVAAFASDGGWIFLYGDEFGATKKINVFDTTPMEYHKVKTLQLADYSEYIVSINRTIAQLPKPSFPEWSQRVFISALPDLVVFIVHQGYAFSSPAFVVVANTDVGRVTLTKDNLIEIMRANGRNNTVEKSIFPEKLYLCGALDIDAQLMRLLGEKNIYKSESKMTDDMLHSSKAAAADVKVDADNHQLKSNKQM